MATTQFFILDENLMQAVATNDDEWEMGQAYEFYNDARLKAEELAVGSPLATYTIVRSYARVAVPKQRPPKVTVL